MSNTQIYLHNNVRVYVSDLTAVGQEAMTRHETTPLSSIVLATAIAAFGPLAAIKPHGLTSVMMRVDGAIKTVLVEGNSDEGGIRALVGNSHIVTEHDASSYNFIPLKLALGETGTLRVITNYKNEHFSGEVALVKNDIVSDLAYYFAQSEQIYTAVVTDVHLASPTKLARAYSAIFQLLPGHHESDAQWVEEFVARHKLSALGPRTYGIALGGKLIAERELKWKCTCSLARMKELINLIDEQEQEAILHEQGKIEVTCNFCNTRYVVKSA